MAESEELIAPDRFRDPYDFEYIIDLQKAIYEHCSELNLSRVSFIEPFSMLQLLLMGRNYLRKSGNRLKLTNIPIQIYQYLHRMDFFKTGVFSAEDTVNNTHLLKRSSFSRRVLEITEISNKERESIKAIENIIGIFRKRAEHILKHWLSSNIIDYFVTVISEICQNIYEHSLDSGYCAMQTYSIGRRNVVRLSIGDSGIGIRKSFDHVGDIVYNSPAHLIELALTTLISSKREFGYGLCQVNAIVKKLKGIIFIRSGNASVSTLYHKQRADSSYFFLKNDLTDFDGTQISISLTG
jgi:anti-sigma regulatory factor (Ser/Thr protein kinase)